jgi:hypothetical protein
MARAVALMVLCGIAMAARPARGELRAPPRMVLRLATADEPTVVVPGQEGAPAPRPVREAPRPAVAAPRPAPVDPDAGLGAKQVGMGFVSLLGTAALASGLFWLADREDSLTLAYASLGVGALMPAAVGMAVCQVGTTSKVYDGRCFPTVGGAYIGALGVLPGVLLGALVGCSSSSSTQSTGDDGSAGLDGLDACFTSVVIGGALGLTIGTLVGAYNGWRIFKRPKPGTLRAALL